MASQCTHCGATIRSRSARYCEFCGTEFPRDPAPSGATPGTTRRAQFEALRAHPDYDRWLNPAPPVATRAQEPAPATSGSLPLGVLFVALACFAAYWLARRSGDDRAILAVPLVLAACLGVVIVSKLRPKTTRRSPKTLPLPPREERHAAIVADERSEVVTVGLDARSTTRYFLTLEFEDGRRREYPVDAQMAGLLSPGDAGIAVVLQRRLRAYHRLDT